MIQMFFRDHAPPHFHASYGEFELVIGIMPIIILEGSAPMRVRSIVLEWAAMHQEELLANWQRCRDRQQLQPIEPLD